MNFQFQNKLAVLVSLLLFSAVALQAQKPAGKAPKIPMPSGDVRAAAPKSGDAPQIQIGKAETFKLDNGLSVIVVENNKLPRVSLRVFVDADPAQEKDAAGYIEMMGELLSKGTKNRSKSQIDEEIDFIGASLGASPSGVSGASLSKHTDKLAEIMADVLMNPTFPEEELEKARKRTASGLASTKDDANAIASNVAAVLRYGKNHPYGEVMTEETLAKISLDQIKNHYNTYFKPNISYLVIVGDITVDKARTLANKYFAKWKKGEVPSHRYPTPVAPSKAQVDFVHKPAAVQSVISITYPIELKPGAPDAIKARVANALFGGYFNSRINANLREGHGWTYGARSSLSSDKLVGNFSAGASVRNAVTDSSITELIKEMDRLRTEKVPESELSVVRNVLTGQFARNLEEPGTIAEFALNISRYGLPADYYQKYLSNLAAVTPDDVMMMSKQYITPANAYILVVGNKEEVADKLKGFSANGKVNFYDIYGNPVTYDNVAVPANVTAETIIKDYVQALGGSDKIAGLKDMYSESKIDAGGMTIVVKNWQKGNKMMATEMKMNGNLMSKRVYDGQTASESGMGGNRTLEGSELEDMKEQAMFVKEASYLSGGYKLALKGIEPVEGKNAYVVEVTRPDGNVSTEYYDMKSSLKLRESSSETGPDGSSTTTTIDYADYKAVNGIMLPYTITFTGMAPFPLKAVVTDVQINAGLDDSVFKQ